MEQWCAHGIPAGKKEKSVVGGFQGWRNGPVPSTRRWFVTFWYAIWWLVEGFASQVAGLPKAPIQPRLRGHPHVITREQRQQSCALWLSSALLRDYGACTVVL